jgi:hypothetical protein
VSRSRSRNRVGDYEVGYRCPPVATRFKLGGVGNPKGRPKMTKTVGQTIQEALMTRITIEENGRSRTVTALEVIIRNLVHAAARRDTKAIHALFALKARYQDSAETSVDPDDLELEDRKIIEEHLARLRESSAGADTQKSDDEPDQDANGTSSTNGEPDRTPNGTDNDT